MQEAKGGINNQFLISSGLIPRRSRRIIEK
jgi:hypothetical protein